MPTFAALKNGYPKEDRATLFRALGGQWPSLIADERNYRNTCALRMSVALTRAGVAIPAQYREAIQGDGTPLVLKVATMAKLVTALRGEPTWGMSKNPGTTIRAADLPGSSGILAYHVQWSDASGHVDLWTGRGFVGAGNLDDVGQGFSLAFWRLD